MAVGRLKPEDAAQEMNVLVQTVYALLDEGKLKGERLAHTWRISREELDSFMGRPDYSQIVKKKEQEVVRELRRDSMPGVIGYAGLGLAVIGLGLYFNFALGRTSVPLLIISFAIGLLFFFRAYRHYNIT